MIKELKWTVLVVILFFSVGVTAQKTKKKNNRLNNNTVKIADDEIRSPFRYVIISGVSDIEKLVNSDEESLDIVVLMEDKAFNEKNLIILFDLLSERFRERPALGVEVYTTLEAIRTPEEYDREDLYGPIENYKKFKWAIYNRNGNGEYFSYGMPGLFNEKYVVIKEGQNRK